MPNRQPVTPHHHLPDPSSLDATSAPSSLSRLPFKHPLKTVRGTHATTRLFTSPPRLVRRRRHAHASAPHPHGGAVLSCRPLRFSVPSTACRRAAKTSPNRSGFGAMRPCRLPPSLAAAALSAAALLLLCGTSPHVLTWPGYSRARHPPPGPPRAARGPGSPPSFAYWISGTGGEGRRVLRLLKAVYHPRNRYLLHLDAGASGEERAALAAAVRAEEAWRDFANVDVLGESYAVDRAGSSVLAAALHGAVVLLRIGGDWDWFVTLSSWDYPLVTQDVERW